MVDERGEGPGKAHDDGTLTRATLRTGDPGRRPTSRRRLLQTTAAAGAGAVLFGGTASADHNPDVSPADRDVGGGNCSDDELPTGDAKVIDNEWSTQDCGGNTPVEQCVFTNDDGSFGWEWSRGVTCEHGNDLPNYPQALLGTKIGPDSSGWNGLPQQMGSLDQFDVQLDVDMDVSDGEWNFALEWWMSPDGSFVEPSDEIMLVVEDSQWHSKGGFVVEEAFEGDYGNTIGYWDNRTVGGEGGDWNFHIFKVREDGVPSHVDLRSLCDYLVEDPDGEVAAVGNSYDGSKHVSGVEIGNENWDKTDGRTVVSQFNVRANGQVGVAGVDDGWSEPENLAPDAPAGLAVTGTTDASASLSWGPASDPDGSVAEYEVSAADGSASATTSSTSVTVDGLESGTSYEFAVTAVDDEGATSPASEPVTATTTGGTPDGCVDSTTVDGRTVCDVNDDGHYRDVNADGEVTQTDVVEFFQVQHREAWKQPSLFDFSDDSSVSHGDVVSLFEYVASSGL